jgi:probable F420-dependent oxidoreductase
MDFGFVLPNHVGIEDPFEVVSVGVHAEAAGFDSLWVNHHVINAGYVRERLGTRPYHDALILLTWLASKTHHARLGTSVLVLPYLHPMVLARELATLDQLAQGRLVVGVGVGSLPDENAAMGVPYAGRGRRADEFLQVLGRLWTEEEATFEGEHFAFEDVVSSPKPLQRPRPPILVGGNKRASLRRVARFGDGWHPLMLSPEGVRDRMAYLRDQAATAGRPHAATRVSVRLDMSQVHPGSVQEYADAGVSELVVGLGTADVDAIRAEIDRFAEAMLASR